MAAEALFTTFNPRQLVSVICRLPSAICQLATGNWKLFYAKQTQFQKGQYERKFSNNNGLQK